MKAISEGTAVITATADGKSATCNVTVSKMVIDVTEVQLDKTELTLKEGEEYQLTATVLPENATYKTVTWTSSKPEVATVSETGLVKAVAAGTVVITAKAGEKTATCTLKVAKSESGSGGIEDMDPEEW
ncbi:MAG: Ig domain-containing protein [Bacteroidales bacterium]|nr:Ig domain-containing protein [Bacteroidales bacterium]